MIVQAMALEQFLPLLPAMKRLPWFPADPYSANAKACQSNLKLSLNFLGSQLI
jgi:hypothetical protein